jgi:hypothetical protein
MTTGFTLGESVAIHAALMESKKNLEQHSHDIIKANGRDVYDSVWRDVGTALEKITTMAKAARELQGDGE